MSRIKIIFVLILILLGICADLMSQPPQNEDYILVINSYSENSPWSYNCTVPIYETLIKEYEELTAYTEHMNMLLIQSEEELSLFEEDFFAKHVRVLRKV